MGKMMKPLSPKIQNYDTQTGIGNNPVFMWKYSSERHRQTAYKINIYHNGREIYSTGKVMSGEQNNIALHIDYEEQTTYSFDVTVWDENDRCEKSETAYFITGVKNWRGKWIGNNTAKPFIARKIFSVEHTGKAVLSVCMPGQFEVKINGRNISPYAYEGSQTDFHKHIHYSTYDVTGFLGEGENEITIEAANGWYIGDDDNGKRYFYTMDKGYTPYGDRLLLLAQLKMDDQYIVSDQSWEVSRSKTVFADIYGSEDMDNTVAYEWSGAKTAEPPEGELIALDYPPVIRKYCYEPKSVDRERMIFDFGQNMSSQFYIKLKGRRGQRVKLR